MAITPTMPRVSRPSATRLARARRFAVAVGVGAALGTLAPAVVAAQRPDSTRTPADTARGIDDSLPTFQRLGAPEVGAKPPISGRRAFLYSFLVPGLGQARLDRPNGGALFATVEMGALLMAYKSAADLRYAKRASRSPLVTAWKLDSLGVPARDTVTRQLIPADTALNRYTTRLRARRVHYEDWVAVILFNHLFAGADAFVAANLWDMPVRGTLRALGPREAALAATIEFGGRRRR